MPRASELTDALSPAGLRPAGSDAERRAALWAAGQITSDPRRGCEIETFWLRPYWAAAQAWHIALAVAGSLVSSTRATVGGAMLLVALIAEIVDWRSGLSPGRLLTRERASQNVVSASPRPHRVHLILTANLDTARLDPDLGGPLPGWLFWITGATLWALITALARVEGSHSVLLAVLQLIPTVALILAGAGLALISRPGDNTGGVGAVLALARLLDAAPPAHLAVDLVLSGAGAGQGRGLTRYLRARRRERDITNTIVLGFAAMPRPRPAFLISDGPGLPLTFFARLRELAADTGALARAEGRGCSPALPARLRRLPALTLTGHPDGMVEAALELIDRIDTYVGALPRPSRDHPDGRNPLP